MADVMPLNVLASLYYFVVPRFPIVRPRFGCVDRLGQLALMRVDHSGFDLGAAIACSIRRRHGGQIPMRIHWHCIPLTATDDSKCPAPALRSRLLLVHDLPAGRWPKASSIAAQLPPADERFSRPEDFLRPA